MTSSIHLSAVAALALSAGTAAAPDKSAVLDTYADGASLGALIFSWLYHLMARKAV
jgi:hypothetical protein